jgi:hypothetical protein
MTTTDGIQELSTMSLLDLDRQLGTQLDQCRTSGAYAKRMLIRDRKTIRAELERRHSTSTAAPTE